MKTTSVAAIAAILACLLCASESRAGSFAVSGLLDIVAKNTGENDITNTTFKGFSNFHSSRTRIFFDSRLSENNYAFIQLLVDNYSVSLYGAYARFENVLSRYVNLQVGFIPATIGTFAARTYSNVNPLVGVPLLYNHHSSLALSGSISIANVDDLLVFKDDRTTMGLPVIYDACWNSGIELYGSTGRFSYSVGALAGSVSKPKQEQGKDIPQITTRLAYVFDPGLIVGVSGLYGPYLDENSYGGTLPEGTSLDDFINSGIGYDLYAARGHVEVYSEGYFARWEYPNLPDLEVVSGYVEGKFTFAPGWYVAGRFGLFEPEEITLEDETTAMWDYAVRRIEFGIGYKPTRNVLAKLVNQRNMFSGADYLDSEIYAVQVSVYIR